MDSEGCISVTVNGTGIGLPEGSAALDAVVRLGYDPSRVAVEIDGAICPRAELPTRRLRGGERMEVVSFVGGGRWTTSRRRA